MLFSDGVPPATLWRRIRRAWANASAHDRLVVLAWAVTSCCAAVSFARAPSIAGGALVAGAAAWFLAGVKVLVDALAKLRAEARSRRAWHR